MRIITRNLRPGNSVIFVYNRCLYSGVISSVGLREYGITDVNASKYVTDHECMLRINNEVFIPKKNCIHTAEVTVPKINDCMLLDRRYGNVIDAYNLSRKKQIFPWYSLSKFSRDVFIKFDDPMYKNRLLFIMVTKDNTDYKVLWYRNIDGHMFLEDIDGNRYNGEWKYHRRSPKQYEEGFDEYSVLRIYVINRSINVSDERRIYKLMNKGYEDVSDILYRYENIPLIHLCPNEKIAKPYIPDTTKKKLDCFGNYQTGMKSSYMFIDENWMETMKSVESDEKEFEIKNGFQIKPRNGFSDETNIT